MKEKAGLVPLCVHVLAMPLVIRHSVVALAPLQEGSNIRKAPVSGETVKLTNVALLVAVRR